MSGAASLGRATVPASPSEQPRHRVLMVDDQPMNLEMLSQRLSRRGFEVRMANSGEAAIAAVDQELPDILLLDIHMPGMSGFDVLANLRRRPDTGNLPIILVSALSDTDYVVEGLQRGANDYVTKPVNLSILLARMQTHLKLASVVAQLEAQTRVLAQLAAVDELTEVFNRRSLFELLEMEFQRSQRHGYEVSLLMIDIDHFKKINDGHGHAVGDRLLRQFAQGIASCIRSTDMLCRYGGEEFCVVLPETSRAAALSTAEKVREYMAAAEFETEQIEPLHITVSIGVDAQKPSEATSIASLIEHADRALYVAKKQGRDRVVAYSDEMAAAS